MTEFKFYNQPDPGTKDKKKPRYESRKMALNQEQDQTEKWQEYFGMTINETDQLGDMHHTNN